MTRRRSSRWRRAAHDMKPNRVIARYISGGRHQTWTAILKSPFRERTVMTPESARRAYEKRMAQARKTQKKTAAKPPPKPKPPNVGQLPIAVDPRTGKPITYAQAQRAVREASKRADRLAAGLPGDPPRKRKS